MNRSALLLAAAAVWLTPWTARAESPLVGNWKQGPMREDFTVQRWLPGCGPAPQSGIRPGSAVVIAEKGDELTITGGDRGVYTTNQCYEEMPTLVRESHSVDPGGRLWRTKCATPPADPRRAVMNTLVVATSPTRIEITETGRYEVKLTEGLCMADVKRSRVLESVVPAAPQASAPTPKPTAVSPEPPKPNACESPGDPARLEVRPSRKLLRTGETFAFRAIVRDGQGCVTSTATSWSVAPAADGVRRVTVEPGGKVTVAADATEGRAEVVATAAGKSARVTVDVASPANYDALLATSGLDKAGENDTAAVVQLEGASIGGGDARAADSASARRNLFLAIVALVVVGLGAVALVFARRSRLAAQLEADALQQHEEDLREAEARHRQRSEEHSQQQQAHEESLHRAQLAAERARATRTAAAAAAAIAAKRPPAPIDRACPGCGREFGGETAFCPHDGNKLVARAANVERAGAAVAGPGASSSSMPLPARGKICPTCGGRFDGAATFCGKDGTALVLLN